MRATIETVNLFDRMRELGFSHEETETMLRAERALRRWGEQECGDSTRRYPIPDREASAKRRIGKIMGRHPDLWFFHQSDPRGCAVWVGRKADVNGKDVATCYTRGVAVSLA